MSSPALRSSFAGTGGFEPAIVQSHRGNGPAGLTFTRLHWILLTLALVCSLCPSTPALAQVPAWYWSNFAGEPGGPGSIDGVGRAARFNRPAGVALDASGNLYVADEANATIRKMTLDGTVTTLAGQAGVRVSRDGTGTFATFQAPLAVTVDKEGNLFVVDGNCVRMITPDLVVTTVAGVALSSGSADGAGSDARFNRPRAIAADTNGNIYVADSDNDTIRKITSDGLVTTLAGSAGNPGTTDGTGSAARFDTPAGIAVDANGNLYVADFITVRKVTPQGVVTRLGGGSYGSNDGTGSAAKFAAPQGLAVDGAGNVYVGDTFDNVIRKITPAGVVSTLAGTAKTSGSTDGMGSAARFNYPKGVAVDGSGIMYVADWVNHTIRKVTPDGSVTTVAGNPMRTGSRDGLGRAALFNIPKGVALDGSGNVFVSDTENHTLRKITPAGVTTTFAGSVGSYGSTDGGGAAARFYNPSALATDRSGNLYVADYFNGMIRKVTPAGAVTTLAGSARNFGSTDGAGSAARFSIIHGITVDGSGNVYAVDAGNVTIRKITSAGVVTTLAGTAGKGGFVDGTGSAARFRRLGGAAVDASGNVYVVDDHTIRKITPTGVVTTFAGAAGAPGYADGIGRAARFNTPFALAADAHGNLYVGDEGNHVVRKITSAGEVTTIGGTPHVAGAVEGLGSAAVLNGFGDMAVNSAGSLLYVADIYDNRVVHGHLTSGANDRTPPVVALSSPSKAAVGATFSVQGTVQENDVLSSLQITFNAAPVPFTGDPVGNFVPGRKLPFAVANLTAENGANSLVIVATDSRGNRTTLRKTFTYTNLRPQLAGTYEALFTPVDATDPSGTGLLTVTVTATGAFSGKVTFPGGSVAVSGILANDGTARFNPGQKATRLLNVGQTSPGTLAFRIVGGTPAATLAGGLSNSSGDPLSRLNGELTLSAADPVPANLLNLPSSAPTRGYYTFIIPSALKSTGADPKTYPSGAGFGTITLQKTGSIAMSGYLADGTPFTAATRLGAHLSALLFVPLYNHRGFIAAEVDFDPAKPDTDLAGAAQWARPANTAAPAYRAGWPAGIALSLSGVKYAAPDSLDIHQGPIDLTNGNVSLNFSNGATGFSSSYEVNLASATGKVQRVPLTSQDYTLTLAPTSGLFSGTLRNENGALVSYRGVLVNKGSLAGGFGYYLQPPATGLPGSGFGGAISLTLPER